MHRGDRREISAEQKVSPTSTRITITLIIIIITVIIAIITVIIINVKCVGEHEIPANPPFTNKSPPSLKLNTGIYEKKTKILWTIPF